MRIIRHASILGLVIAALILADPYPAGASARSQLRAKALSVSNLPAGWSVEISTSSGGVTGSACLEHFKQARPHDTRIKVSFVDGTVFPALSEELESGPNVSSAYGKFVASLDSCQKFTFSEGGNTYHGTVGAMSFPTVGTRSRAYSIDVTIEGVAIGIDIVGFRVGRLEGDVIYGTVGTPDLGPFQSFVNEAIAKVEGKPTSTLTAT
jgi:hypothetical protein